MRFSDQTKSLNLPRFSNIGKDWAKKNETFKQNLNQNSNIASWKNQKD